MLPAMIYEVNNAPFQRKDKVNLASEFLKGKDMLNTSLKHIKQTIANKIGEVRKEMKMGHEVLQAQLTAATNSISTLTGLVQQLQESCANTQRAILAQSAEMAFSRNIIDLATTRMATYINWLVETDAGRKAILKNTLDELQASEEALKTKMVEAKKDAHLILGGPPGLSLPPILPSTSNNPTSPPQAETLPSSSNPTNQMAASSRTIRIPSLKRPRTDPSAALAQQILSQAADVQMDTQDPNPQTHPVCHDANHLSRTLMATYVVHSALLMKQVASHTPRWQPKGFLIR